MYFLPLCDSIADDMYYGRYGVQVASALLVFILMWILLATLDNGLKDPKHFDPGTKHTFWVGVVHVICNFNITVLYFVLIQVLALIVVIVGFVFTLPFQIFVREKSNVKLKKLTWYKWLQNPQFYLVKITME